MGGIWIRSQDKKRLVFATNVFIDDYGNFTLVKADSRIIGEYPTKERALQVLDEIEQFIVDCEHCKDDKMFYPVFQMPTE